MWSGAKPQLFDDRSPSPHTNIVIVNRGKLWFTFAALLHQGTWHQGVLDGVEQLSVGLETGQAALEAGLGHERPGKVLVHRGSDSACKRTIHQGLGTGASILYLNMRSNFDH